jgi:hypothetical protein
MIEMQWLAEGVVTHLFVDEIIGGLVVVRWKWEL